MAQDLPDELWNEKSRDEYADDESSDDVFADELTDDELIDAARNLSDYTEEGQQVMMEELQERGLQIPIQETIPRPRKSVAVAVLLAFFFGPIGMVYVGRFWQSFLMSCFCFIGGIAFGVPVLERILSPHTMETYIRGIGVTYVVLHVFVFPLWAYSRARAVNRIQ
jgi:hypothetical protein